MNSTIQIGIMGYGNLGRGVELAIRQNPDMTLAAFFTRRAPETLHTLTPDVPVYHVDRLSEFRDQIDVLILCGGSASDLPVQSPECARMFNIVDSFDTHASIPEHFARCDTAAREAGTTALISAGACCHKDISAQGRVSKGVSRGPSLPGWGYPPVRGHG